MLGEEVEWTLGMYMQLGSRATEGIKPHIWSGNRKQYIISRIVGSSYLNFGSHFLLLSLSFCFCKAWDFGWMILKISFCLKKTHNFMIHI